MTDTTSDTIAIQNAIERLRQEKETFEQRKIQEDKWFSLRLRMGYAAVILLPTVAGISGYIILNSSNYSVATVTVATSALFVDVLGLMGAIWKVVLNSESVTVLNPVTGTTDLRNLPNGRTEPQGDSVSAPQLRQTQIPENSIPE